MSNLKSTQANSTRRISFLKGLWPFIRPYRGRMILAFFLLCLGSATILLVPLAFRDLIDFGFGGRQNTGGGLLGSLSLNGHFIALFALASLWALTIAARYYTVSWVGERVTADLRSAVYARVLTQSPQFFETLQTGEVLSRLTGDTTLIQTVVGSSISMGLRSLFQFIGGMVMLAVTSLYLFSLNLGLMALLILPIMAIGRKVKKLSRESQDKIADASALAGEILNAVPTVQAYTQEQREINRFADRAEVSFNTAIRRSRVRAALTAIIIMAVMGSIIFVLWIGANLVNAGTMTGGQLASFVLYATLVAGGVSTMAEVWGDVMRATGATERLLELLHAKPAIVGADSPQLLPQTGKAEIQFDQVSFRYPSRLQTTALDKITLDIASGESVALVGPSGAGKTTLFQLLLRFYDVSDGSIRFNGQDIRELSLHELRDKIAIVPQDSVIFSANALENIRYGRPDASNEEVIAAAKSAQVEEFINRLPDGYQTFLGERGTRLSGGQRQRIAIARAILKNAQLLLLDEATSALDAESEILVQEGLNAAMQGRTTLIIAHRLATVKKVDRIIVMDEGRIVEMGSPEDLRNQSGLYARLASLQFDV
ncbi:MAG: ABC transporter transmembrane domain-containing protein [Methylococcaceae bacterium]|nr:ABC transporter transmembrane domain-containing protein [Methylococcaceae bacterium]MDZ4156817.1 ABC transporter transmembrane domain-containing protein [Methylococcales bacterium]MDP2391727.1 ABC transporter transmembrane domain-containing protein [Methylococcaceae bacterium]MDP3018401.1 ABC transporter transmembrane domain-containing protein [Methylococcaceae bacterium]MDP3389443.1 ABC transporter transmembrane domain-containing protein [Methylococcaceae bacterium]